MKKAKVKRQKSKVKREQVGGCAAVFDAPPAASFPSAEPPGEAY